MKVLEKAFTPNGVKIQIEDWKEKYSFIKTLNIACYPMATKTQNSPFGLRNGKIFRLALDKFKNDKEVYKTFNKLQSGEITIKELSNKFEEIPGIDDILEYL